MSKRFVSIWFRHLTTDWFSLRQPHLHQMPFVLRARSHGRMIIAAANAVAMKQGIVTGMVLADARAICPDIQIDDDRPDLRVKLLNRLADWCIRFTPVVAVDAPDGLIFDATGCCHLWGGEESYVNAIVKKLIDRGYDVHAAIADTPGVAWAMARYGQRCVVPVSEHIDALIPLPAEALRTDPEVIERLHKLGLHRIGQFLNMSRESLRRRFGQQFLHRLDIVTGREAELIIPVHQVEPYHERLPCLEPIVTASGIETALELLLKRLCYRLKQEQKGLRRSLFKGYRVDGKIEQIEIGTNRPSHHVKHLSKLFEIKLPTFEPALGIELFVLEASKVENCLPAQEILWPTSGGLDDERLSELLDRLTVKTGAQAVRYLPDEHYWPERSIKPAASLNAKLPTPWNVQRLRPLQLLSKPEKIDVTAPIPDYPPMLFKHHGKLHRVIKADGPERIEQEWWLQDGQHRDYYRVEDEEGKRYWLFRLGHYHDKKFQWFLHGYFA